MFIVWQLYELSYRHMHYIFVIENMPNSDDTAAKLKRGTDES